MKNTLSTEVLDNICSKNTFQHFQGQGGKCPPPLPMPAGAHVNPLSGSLTLITAFVTHTFYNVATILSARKILYILHMEENLRTRGSTY